MKKMKYYLKIAIISIIVSTGFESDLISQPTQRHQVRSYINRTVLIIHEAKKQLEIGKNYNGDYARAVAHQKYARNLFLTGKFQKSVFHSHRARVLAYAVIRNNKGIVLKDLETTKEEETLHANQPKDEELDRVLLINDPKLTFDDRAAAQAQVKGIEDK
jgi:hypothetical protein